MKAIIIEDEKLSAEHLQNLLHRIDNTIEIITVIDSVKKAIETIANGVKADLLFVDIHLADGLSFELFSTIHIDTPVIFTTAYDQYAIKAFKLNSIDYLLKPIAKEDLQTALAKFNKQQTTFSSTIIQDIATAYQQLTKQYKNRFMVKMGDTITSIKAEAIAHFIFEDSITLLVTVAGKRYPVDFTLDQLETLLAPNLFFRINRKVLIAISEINKVSAYFNGRLKISSELLTDEAAIVSRERVTDFKNWLDK
jgi:DNA-binding LytR/AlgR family response regulator